MQGDASSTGLSSYGYDAADAEAGMRVAIIGAGAAGIAAGRAASEAGHEVMLFEARDRVGGRTLTDTSFAAHPVELGAEFIHGEAVATWDWVREFDAPTNGDAHRYEVWSHFRGELVPSARVADVLGSELSPGMRRLTGRWNREDRPDAPMSEVLESWSEQFGTALTAEDRALAANWAAQGTSADLEELGAYRVREATYRDDGELHHWRLTAGYSSLMARAAAGLELRLGTVVSRVRWDEVGTSLTTPDGEERFDAAIVTLPLGVLKRDAVEFDPPLPEAKRDAIARLNAGHISKVILKLDQVYWPPDLTFMWTPLDTQLWWRPGQGQPNEEPVLTAFFGGRDAAALEDASEGDAIEAATRDLERILGRSLAEHVLAGRYAAWGAEEFTRMGYSSVPPGGLGLRAALAEPIGALHFAGEATNVERPATVHGAIESGRRAAEELGAA